MCIFAVFPLHLNLETDWLCFQDYCDLTPEAAWHPGKHKTVYLGCFCCRAGGYYTATLLPLVCWQELSWMPQQGAGSVLWDRSQMRRKRMGLSAPGITSPRSTFSFVAVCDSWLWKRSQNADQCIENGCSNDPCSQTGLWGGRVHCKHRQQCSAQQWAHKHHLHWRTHCWILGAGPLGCSNFAGFRCVPFSTLNLPFLMTWSIILACFIT